MTLSRVIFTPDLDIFATWYWILLLVKKLKKPWNKLKFYCTSITSYWKKRKKKSVKRKKQDGKVNYIINHCEWCWYLQNSAATIVCVLREMNYRGKICYLSKKLIICYLSQVVNINLYEASRPKFSAKILSDKEIGADLSVHLQNNINVGFYTSASISAFLYPIFNLNQIKLVVDVVILVPPLHSPPPSCFWWPRMGCHFLKEEHHNENSLKFPESQTNINRLSWNYDGGGVIYSRSPYPTSSTAWSIIHGLQKIFIGWLTPFL